MSQGDVSSADLRLAVRAPWHRCRRAARAVPGQRRPGHATGCPDLRRAASAPCRRCSPCSSGPGWMARSTSIAFTEGQDVKAGDLLADDRPAPLPGRAGPGDRQEGRRYGHARQRQAGPRPLLGPGPQRLRLPPKRRHAGGVRLARAPPTRRRTTPRSPRPSSTSISPASRRRSRAGSGCAWSTPATSSTPATRGHRDHQPDPSDLGAVHLAAGACSRPCRTRSTPPPAPLQVQAFSRDDKRQLSDGTLLTVDNAIDTTTGTIRLKAHVPERRRPAVAGSVRQRAPAAAAWRATR